MHLQPMFALGNKSVCRYEAERLQERRMSNHSFPSCFKKSCVVVVDPLRPAGRQHPYFKYVVEREKGKNPG